MLVRRSYKFLLLLFFLGSFSDKVIGQIYNVQKVMSLSEDYISVINTIDSIHAFESAKIFYAVVVISPSEELTCLSFGEMKNAIIEGMTSKDGYEFVYYKAKSGVIYLINYPIERKNEFLTFEDSHCTLFYQERYVYELAFNSLDSSHILPNKRWSLLFTMNNLKFKDLVISWIYKND